MPSRDRLRHPGPPAPVRYGVARAAAVPAAFKLPAGSNLSAAVAAAMDGLDADCGVFTLDGLHVRDGEYVMPAGPRDASHAAWYSEPHPVGDAVLDRATATVGRKDGAWFLHCHAMWRAPGHPRPAMGHLLCPGITLAAPFAVRGHVFRGATLTVRTDAETGFPLFHLDSAAASGAARLVTVRPHEDLRETIERAARETGLADAAIVGIGSLVGARFAAGPDMESPLSEILVLPGSVIAGGACTHLHVACVDPAGDVFTGDLRPGDGPVCVTAEIALLPTPGAH